MRLNLQAVAMRLNPQLSNKDRRHTTARMRWAGQILPGLTRA